jgi:NADH:ubiquinone oxidoreductase subunit D
MHANFYRFFYNNYNCININLLKDILYFNENFIFFINEINNILLKNKILKGRLVNNGIIKKKECYTYKLTGVLQRSVGIKKDIRLDKFLTYANYKFLSINSYIGKNGDSYDRFLIRINEQIESINIINQLIKKIFFLKKKNIFLKNFFFKKNKMENIISHFKY